MKYENLFTPFNIGGCTIKNRYCLSPMGSSIGLGPYGEPNQLGADYFVKYAQGGAGLIITGSLHTDMSVDPFSPQSGQCVNYSPSNFKRNAVQMNSRVHGYGAKIFAQISAGMGRNYPGLRAPSAIPTWAVPSMDSIEITKEEIKQKVEWIVKAAQLMKASDFDGVEVHALHWGYLLDEFAMSLTNKRNDEYGGSLENRLRICKEIIDGIKHSCGHSFPVSIRLGLKAYVKGLFKPSFDGNDEAGRTIEEGVRICQLLENYGFDAFNVDAGIYDSFYYAAPPMYIEQGFTIDLAAEAKKAVKIPIIVGGSRISDPDICSKAIADGKADAIAMGRPLLADAQLPMKVMSGMIEDIRPCIGCNECIRLGFSIGDATCAVNPSVMRESWYDVKLSKDKTKNVIIIGGGIAGMQAAITAKERGHDVHLFEKAPELGGSLIAAGCHSFKKDISRLNEWYQRELKKKGVIVTTNKAVDASFIKSLKPDAVILALGASPVKLDVPGIDKAYGCLDILPCEENAGSNVVIVGGGSIGCEMALEYARDGKKVTIVEMMDKILSSGAPVCFVNSMYLNDAMKYYGVDFCMGHSLTEVKDSGVIVTSSSDGKSTEINADTVIISVGFTPDKAKIGKELLGAGFPVFEIGDGRKVGNIASAVAEAYESARNI